MLEPLIQMIGVILVGMALLSVLVTMLQYPYDVDGASFSDPEAKQYYSDAYEAALAPNDGRFVEGEEYVQKARAHAQAAGIPRMVESFVKASGVEDGRVLEVGAGSGLLQDVVRRYVGVDVSSRARRFFHKPFLEASATALPFESNAFDAVWSIWVLEHIPNPEQALNEIRRVVKDGGHILLRPAWNCDSWAAEGYEVRPYSDFGFWGKLIKASIPLRASRWYSLFHSRQVRVLRTIQTALGGGPSRLHFRRLKPSYARYWVTDSDAVVSLDFFETYLWFASRGDSCVNCPSLSALLLGRPGLRDETLVIQVRKSERPAAGHKRRRSPQTSSSVL